MEFACRDDSGEYVESELHDNRQLNHHEKKNKSRYCNTSFVFHSLDPTASSTFDLDQNLLYNLPSSTRRGVIQIRYLKEIRFQHPYSSGKLSAIDKVW